MTSATYVYCIVRCARKPRAGHGSPTGLPGSTRLAVDELVDGLWLVTASVPLDQYGPRVLEASLRDLEWVSAIALAHEAVVEYFAHLRGATVVPMKLFTMFSTLGRAVAELQRKRGALDRIFERVQGCDEWGVRVTRGEVRHRGGRSPTPRTGGAFLTARKQARESATKARRAAAEVAELAFASLAGLARDQRRREEDTAAGAVPLLDAAFLVPSRRRAQFHAAARRLARDVARSGGRMTLTGPWPPYNFVGTQERA